MTFYTREKPPPCDRCGSKRTEYVREVVMPNGPMRHTAICLDCGRQMMVAPDTTPWTIRELQAALEAAGWQRLTTPDLSAYRSPDDPAIIFDCFAPSRLRRGRPLWEYFAERHELPATTRPPF